VTEILPAILAAGAGLMLGGIFFGGLWWTVRRGVVSTRPVLWFSASFLLRMSTTLAGFYLVGRGHWERLALCLLGFVVARFAVTRWIQAPAVGSSARAGEVTRAP
jgi:F1F0 ATPase subunit 2